MPRLVNGLEQIFTNLGIVGAGYKIFTFETATDTPKTSYSDDALSVANPNPIVCLSSGRPEYDIWGEDPAQYRVVLATPDSDFGDLTIIKDVDPVDDVNAGSIIVLDPLPVAYWGATGGTSTAYTLDPALVPITSYSNKQCFLIDFHIACGASPTLAINGLSAIDIKKKTGQGTKASLQAGDLQVGRYLCYNDGTDIVVYNTRGEPLYIGSPLTSTISSGAVTITTSNVIVDTEGGAASDDLVTINGGVDGMKIVLSIANASRDVTVKHNTGNIYNPNQVDIFLDLAADKLELVYSSNLGLWLITSQGTRLSFLNSKASNGYTYSPNGLIFQWATGADTTTGDSTQVVNFPITFPTAVLHSNVSTKNTSASSSADAWFQEDSITTSNITVRAQWNGSGSVAGGVTPKIFVIGY